MFEYNVAKSSPRNCSRGCGAATSHIAPSMLIAAAGFCLSLSVAAFGQGNDSGARYELPPICLAKNGPGAANEALSAIAQAIHHRSGKSAQSSSTDVTFACGIIARDLAVIELARQELRYGKDPSTKAIARSVLTNAQSEIGIFADRLTGPSI